MVNIELSNRTIEKESNDISIPFVSLPSFKKNVDGVSMNINFLLERLYSESSEKLGVNNSIKSTDNVLLKNAFGEDKLGKVIYNQLEKELRISGLNLENIQGLEVNRGMLSIKVKNVLGEESSIDFDLSAKSIDKLLIKQQIQEVKEDVESSIVDYAIGGTIFSITFLSTARHELERGKRSLQKMIFTQNGVKHVIEINEIVKSNFGEVDLIKILEKKGVGFNPETNKFEFKNTLDSIRFNSIESALKKWTYQEYISKMKEIGINDIKTEYEFKELKNESAKFINEIRLQNSQISFGKRFIGSIERIGGKAMHYVLLPIFLQELHKNSGSDASYISSATEVIGFMGGAKLGGMLLTKFGAKHPLVLLVGSLLAGGAGAVLGEEVLHSMDEKILNYLPNKDIESLQKSMDVHLLTGGSIYDFLDWINFNFSDGFLDMTNNINLGISPEIYLSKRFSGVNHWNKELKEYKIRTSEKIDIFLEKDFKYSDVLNEKGYYDTVSEYVFGNSFEEKLYEVVQYKDGSRAIHYEKKAREITGKIIEFMENNLDKNIYVGDKESFNIFLDTLKIELGKYVKNKNNIEEILGAIEYFCEEEFNEQIGDMVGSEGFIVNDLQKESVKITKDILFYQYHQYKKENKYIFTGHIKNDDNHNTIAEFEKNNIDNDKENEKISFIKSLVNIQIDKNKIDADYILSYKEIVEKKNEIIDLALDGKLSSKQEEGKYLVISNGKESFVPTITDGGIRYYKIEENVKDLLYISNLSEKDRKFIKNKVLRKIIIGEDIVSNSSVGNVVGSKWKKLLENKEIYEFYKRIILVQKQNSFIVNIEKNGDAVEWSSPVMNAIDFIGNKIGDILN